MDVYDRVAQTVARDMTNQFSSSFGTASRLFAKRYRQDIYNIYGLVRLADEIVDTYRPANMRELLDELEADTYRAIKDGYSSNLIVHAFQITANNYGIGKDLIGPFFDSMRTDIKPPQQFSQKTYDTYIYGSANVVGLMCLKVFCEGNQKLYQQLRAGAEALGSAFQKVNFLRDLADDHTELNRFYFPDCSYKTFDDTAKQQVVDDIAKDFETSMAAINQLPVGARKPVLVAYKIYQKLLHALDIATVEQIKQQRLRISDRRKLSIAAAVWIGWRVKV